MSLKVRLLSIIAVLILSIPAGEAYGEILRCSGTSLGTKEDPYDFEIRVEIVLPDPTEYAKNQVLTMVEGRDGRFVAIVGSAAVSHGLGLVEVISMISSQETKAKQTSEKVRHQFVVTQRPREGFSLVGFYLLNGRPMVLKADLWDNSRRFTLASTVDALGMRQYSGRCE